MSDASISYFPVGNGDTVLIRLADKTDIILDCNITEASEDEEDVTRYDVHGHLLKEVKKRDDRTPHVDAFILTHPDQDHCRGFGTVYYTGDPVQYADSDRRAGLILIDELWFTPRLFSGAESSFSDDAKAFRQEARRRMELYRQGSPSRQIAGNRLRIIGFSDASEMKGLESIISSPGSTLNLVNGSIKNDFSFFIHAPFKDDVDATWEEHNLTSVVLQTRFDVDQVQNAVLAFFGGDAGCEVWESILDRSDDDTLQWDLFLAPHHCSWSFFSREPYKQNKTPSNKCIELLNKKREGAIVVASSKPIRDDDDNPPHYPARTQYVKVVGDKKFYCTMEFPNQKKPLPLKFRITAAGPQKVEDPGASAITSSAAIKSTVNSPQTYG